MLWIQHPSLPTTEAEVREEGWGGVLAIAQTNPSNQDALLCVAGEDRSTIETFVPTYSNERFEVSVAGMDIERIQSIEVGDRTFYQVATQDDLVSGAFVYEEALGVVVIQC